MSKKDDKKDKSKLIKPAKVNGNSFINRNLYSIIICVFSFVLYANSIPNDYNLDDSLVTMNHPLTSKGISAIPQIFASTYYNDGHYAYEYRPVTSSSFAIEHSFFGENPHMSHLINVLLYCLCCFLLYKTLLKIFPALNPLFQLAVVLLFIAHPAHTEVVASIKNRDEILAFIFCLLSLQAAFRFVEEKKWWWLPASVLLFIAALLSKLTIFSFAIIIPLTLMLFTDASFSVVVSLAALFIASSFTLINLHDIIIKIVLCILLLLGIIATYFFIKPPSLLSFFSIKKMSDVLKNEDDYKLDPTALLKPGTGFKVLITGIIPSAGMWSFQAAFFPLILFAVSFSGLFFKFPALLVIGSTALLILILKGNLRVSWWAAILFYLVAILILIPVPLGMTFFDDMVAIALIYQIFFGPRDLFLPSLLLYLLLAMLNLFAYHYWQPFLYYFVAFICLRWKYTWPVFLVFMGLAVQSAWYYISTERLFYTPTHKIFTIYTEYYSGILIVFTAIVLLLKRSLTRPLALTFGVLSIAISVYLIVNPQTINYKSTDERENKIINTIKQVNSSLVPGKINRPLSFIEQPVSDKSALTYRLGTSAEILFIYLHKTILPYPMAFYYGYRFINPVKFNSAISIAGFILYLFLLCLALWLLKKNVLPAYALLIYLIAIIAFSNFLQPAPGMVAERFMFIPSLGWCILFVWLLMKLFKVDSESKKLSFSALPPTAKYAFTVLLILYSGLTFVRNFEWKDEFTLFSHDIDYVNNSAQANYLLAHELVTRSLSDKDQADAEKLREDAAQRFQTALDIDPNYMNAAYAQGNLYAMIAAYYINANNTAEGNRYDELAKTSFKKSIQIDSSYTEAQFQLALIFDQQNHLDDAIPLYYKVIETQPLKIVAYNNLALDYFKLERYMQSIEINRLALKNMPNAHDPVMNIAHTFFAINQMDSAYVWMEKAYAITPNDHSLVEALYNMSLKKGDTAKTAYYANILGMDTKGQ